MWSRGSYWKNTSDNAIIRTFIDYAGSSITQKLEITACRRLYSLQRIDDSLTYDYLHSSEENLWSILYLSGYLTAVHPADLPEMPAGLTALTIPNMEIREIFESTVMKWFEDSVKEWNRQTMIHAVWNGDTETLTQEMNRLLRRTISYHELQRGLYHAFLAGIFAGAGYVTRSNREPR